MQLGGLDVRNCLPLSYPGLPVGEGCEMEQIRPVSGACIEADLRVGDDDGRKPNAAWQGECEPECGGKEKGRRDDGARPEAHEGSVGEKVRIRYLFRHGDNEEGDDLYREEDDTEGPERHMVNDGGDARVGKIRRYYTKRFILNMVVLYI